MLRISDAGAKSRFFGILFAIQEVPAYNALVRSDANPRFKFIFHMSFGVLSLYSPILDGGVSCVVTVEGLVLP